MYFYNYTFVESNLEFNQILNFQSNEKFLSKCFYIPFYTSYKKLTNCDTIFFSFEV